ncbi:hypothetical protein LINPERHAP2_LOCUS26339 [Linum perenne]
MQPSALHQSAEPKNASSTTAATTTSHRLSPRSTASLIPLSNASRPSSPPWKPQFELALEECGGDVDAAIHHLCRLSLQEEAEPKPDLPTSWAELLVAEMTKVTSVDDARSRAGKLLEDLEKAVAEKEIGRMRKRVEVLGKENSLLKRAVAILYERQKDRNEKEAESMAVKKLVVILVEIEEDSRDSSGDRLSADATI